MDVSGWALIDGAAYPGPGAEGELAIPASTPSLAADGYMVLSRFNLPTIPSL